MIETALRAALESPHHSLQQFYGMMQYHLGWLDRDFTECKVARRGKRIRSLLTLLACQGAGGKASQALPAAVAVELIHNFSLVHDDIEDRSSFRRHRETVWRIWGDAHSINVGDGLFAMARLHVGTLLDRGVAPVRVLGAIRALDEACLALTEGQFLDLQFERTERISLDDYLWMIRGKTAALLAAACQIGACVATDDPAMIKAMREFGFNVGMAFQIEDDIMGIWGDSATTGKDTGDDIIQKKKTLPIVFALDPVLVVGAGEPPQNAFALIDEVYGLEVVSLEDAKRVADALKATGAREYCEDLSRQYTLEALKALSHPNLSSGPAEDMRLVAQALLGRAF